MENKKRQFRIIVEEGDGYFIAEVPALPGCHTQARSIGELKKRIQEAVLLCLEEANENPEYREQIESLAYEPSFVGLETIEA